MGKTQDELMLEKELRDGRGKLKGTFDKLEEVLDSQADFAQETNKARDVEAIARLAKTMVEIQTEIRETNKNLHGTKNPQVVNNTQKNYVYKGGQREIIDNIEEEKDK